MLGLSIVRKSSDQLDFVLGRWGYTYIYIIYIIYIWKVRVHTLYCDVQLEWSHKRFNGDVHWGSFNEFTLPIPFTAPANGAGEAQVSRGTLCQAKVSVDSSPGLKGIIYFEGTLSLYSWEISAPRFLETSNPHSSEKLVYFFQKLWPFVNNGVWIERRTPATFIPVVK